MREESALPSIHNAGAVFQSPGHVVCLPSGGTIITLPPQPPTPLLLPPHEENTLSAPAVMISGIEPASSDGSQPSSGSDSGNRRRLTPSGEAIRDFNAAGVINESNAFCHSSMKA